MRAPKVPVPSPRVVSVAIGLALAGVLALLVWLLVTVAELSADLDRADQRLDRAQSAAGENQDAAAALARQVRRLGGKPVVAAPSPVPGPQGVQGIQGVPGLPGPAPTLAQVIDALAVYCADDRCRGADGRDGARGERGATGQPGETVTGPPGPAGPAGETGPAGPPGPAGEDGQDGRDGATGPRGEPGPTCPEGYHAEERTIRTDQAPQGETAVVCVADQA